MTSPNAGGIGGVDVILFDVFGTVVDWRGSIIRHLGELADEKGWDLDAAEFADEWRSRYRPSMDQVMSGALPWTNLDDLHRASAVALLEDRSISASAADIGRMVDFWHRLDAWPDSAEGLRRLRRRYVVGTMSNGNVSLLVDLSRHAGLDWDVILSAELAHCYKGDLDAYRHNVALVGRALPNVMMAAAHPVELERVSGIGMRTAFISRPAEYGDHGDTLAPGQTVDVACRGIDELAAELGL